MEFAKPAIQAKRMSYYAYSVKQTAYKIIYAITRYLRVSITTPPGNQLQGNNGVIVKTVLFLFFLHRFQQVFKPVQLYLVQGGEKHS